MQRLACLLILGCATAQAQQPATFCSDIQDPTERLACFDRQYPTRSAPAPAPREPAPEVAEPVTKPSTLTVPAAVVPPVAPAASTATEPAIEERPISTTQSPQPASSNNEPTVERSPLKQGGMFARDPELNLSQTVAAVRTNDSQRMVFRLANDEVWIQLNARMLSIRAGDKVTIKNGRFGGYMMTSESGTKTRVRRIK